MKKKLLQILSLGLTVVTITGNSLPIFAYNVDENGNSIESVEYQNNEDENFTNSANVFAELGSQYKVTIPKTIVLSGTLKSASYYVKAEGDIAGDETIDVTPDDNFNLYSVNKDTQTASVSQDRTSWFYSNLNENANGQIKAPTITAGKWQGTFNFNINLTKVLGDIILPASNDDSFVVTINAGESKTLISPSADVKSFTSDNEDIIKINPDGTFETIGAGNAIITVIDKNGNIRKIPVVVEKIDNIETNLNLDEEIHLLKGNALNLITASNSKIPLKNVKFISSNPDILTVDEEGNVNAVGNGIATITITSDNSIDKVITISSDNKDELNISMDNEKPVSIEAGETIKKINVPDAILTSENSDIVSVDKEGNIIPKNVGKTTVTVTTPDGKTKQIFVDVKPTDNIVASSNGNASNVFNIKATDNSKINLASNNTMLLKDITFESSNPDIATVDNNGNVKTLKEGTTTITIKSSNSLPKTVTIVVGHKEGNVVIENKINANCTTAGSYDEVIYCASGDGYEISRVSKTIPALGHKAKSAVKENEVPATCTKDGSYDEVVYCSVCNTEISRTKKTIAALGHNYVEGTCTRCGATLPALSVSVSGFNGTYDGKAHGINVTSAGNTIQYSTDNKTWSSTNPTFTSAGTYTVYYKVSKDTYKTVTGSANVVIQAYANMTITLNNTSAVLYHNGAATNITNGQTYKIYPGDYIRFSSGLRYWAINRGGLQYYTTTVTATCPQLTENVTGTFNAYYWRQSGDGYPANSIDCSIGSWIFN